MKTVADIGIETGFNQMDKAPTAVLQTYSTKSNRVLYFADKKKNISKKEYDIDAGVWTVKTKATPEQQKLFNAMKPHLTLFEMYHFKKAIFQSWHSINKKQTLNPLAILTNTFKWSDHSDVIKWEEVFNRLLAKVTQKR